MLTSIKNSSIILPTTDFSKIFDNYCKLHNIKLPPNRYTVIVGVNKNFNLHLDIAGCFSKYFKRINSPDTIHYIKKNDITDRAIGKVIEWIYTGNMTIAPFDFKQINYLCNLWEIEKLQAILNAFKNVKSDLNYSMRETNIIKNPSIRPERKKKILSICKADGTRVKMHSPPLLQ
ncbi:BTB/POZ-like domain and BTB/POZ fold domain-containing protein [Strongyloides ratti]|uniref:BTB/POZ-like domain and BTB/POZ fold domain-containing protein n=1 Tax=Strongyloides ratti TaxID=34506 RepID=A0A090MW23_STRRB|nr:BTB/POZ-like domain and BTB/POZ fold domain-containing protein [Strongyloides ratti]CEF63338.1 BTB/POZ-like domain and BTB/POZ fold domain-containing protein [Strongyloides ratti]